MIKINLSRLTVEPNKVKSNRNKPKQVNPNHVEPNKVKSNKNNPIQIKRNY
jgi:hypothetical protein